MVIRCFFKACHKETAEEKATIYKCLNYESFPEYPKDMLRLCVSLYTLLEELIFYHYVNWLLLLMATTLSVTLRLRNSLRTADAFPVVATGNASAVRRLLRNGTLYLII